MSSKRMGEHGLGTAAEKARPKLEHRGEDGRRRRERRRGTTGAFQINTLWKNGKVPKKRDAIKESADGARPIWRRGETKKMGTATAASKHDEIDMRSGAEIVRGRVGSDDEVRPTTNKAPETPRSVTRQSTWPFHARYRPTSTARTRCFVLPLSFTTPSLALPSRARSHRCRD